MPPTSASTVVSHSEITTGTHVVPVDMGLWERPDGLVPGNPNWLEVLILGKRISFESATIEELGKAACENAAVLGELVDNLEGDSRVNRQRAADAIYLVSCGAPEKLAPLCGQLADGLHRPEVRTRHALLDALTNLVPIDADATQSALPGAEASLYDDHSGPLRLAAFRFIAAFGASAEDRSEKVWPLMDEAIQCYHGDPEFQDMLTAVLDFAKGEASPDVRAKLISRMEFDAQNTHGQLARRATQIVSAAKQK